METKVCKKCNRELPIEDFRKYKQCESGYGPKCKKCCNEERRLSGERKRYYEKHKKQERELNKKWKQEHKDKVKEYERKRKKKYKDILSQKKKEYYKTEKAKTLKKQADKRRENAKKKVVSTLTIQEWEDILKSFNYSCAYCGLQSGKLTQDHFVPVSEGGEYTINNIIPACARCNSSKNNSEFEKWYKIQPFYSETRKKKIYKYLNYKNGIQQLSLIV